MNVLSYLVFHLEVFQGLSFPLFCSSSCSCSGPLEPPFAFMSPSLKEKPERVATSVSRGDRGVKGEGQSNSDVRGEGKRGPATSLGQQVSPITNLSKNSLTLGELWERLRRANRGRWGLD